MKETAPWIRFLIYTFILTWVVGIIFILPLQGLEKLLELPKNSISNVVGKYGPTLGGIATVAVLAGWPGIKRLLAQGIKWKVGVQSYLWALLLPFLTKIPIFWTFDSPMELQPLSWSILGTMATAFATHLFLGGGFGEEFGWRGVMLPELSKKYKLLKSTMVIAFFWVIWHVPAYLLGGKGVEEPIIPFIIAVLALSIIMSWLYYQSQQSVLILAILHAMLNASGKIVAAGTNVALSAMENPRFFWMEALILVAVAVWLLLWHFKDFRSQPETSDYLKPT